MSFTEVTCVYCEVRFMKDNREVNRAQRKGLRHFCTRSCAAAFGADQKRASTVVLTCACGSTFQSTTLSKAKKHCSRSCAARFSSSDQQRAAQRRAGHKMIGNLIRSSDLLRRRESWKYVDLRRALQGRAHTFEFEVGGAVFDLALHDTRVVVEFDGPYHCGPKQRAVDAKKDKIAEQNGFRVERRAVRPNQVISSDLIADLIAKLPGRDVEAATAASPELRAQRR